MSHALIENLKSKAEADRVATKREYVAILERGVANAPLATDETALGEIMKSLGKTVGDVDRDMRRIRTLAEAKITLAAVRQPAAIRADQTAAYDRAIEKKKILDAVQADFNNAWAFFQSFEGETLMRERCVAMVHRFEGEAKDLLEITP